MSNSIKTTQLQIRVTTAQKVAIQQAAQREKLDMSSYVLKKVLPMRSRVFQDLLNELVVTDEPRFILSEINTLLSQLNSAELEIALSVSLPFGLSEYLSNYIAAMVETLCYQHHVITPEWVTTIKPLSKPVFASKLQNLRLYLLTHSCSAFRCRNIFVDTTIGGQV